MTEQIGGRVYHEVIEESHQAIRSSFKDKDGAEYNKKSGEFTYEWSESDGEKSVVSSVVVNEPVTQIVNGKVITIFKKTTSKSDIHKKFKTVKRYWSQSHEVKSVTEILSLFGTTLKALKEEDYILFNSIATTDYGVYWSDYNYWEIEDLDLPLALEKAAAVYKSSISAAESLHLAASIQLCEEGAVALIIPSNDINKNNKDGWKIHAQFFAATCSKDSVKNQIFAWAAYKEGQYLPNQYSESNAELVQSVVEAWLYSHIPLLVSCTSSPAQPMHIWAAEEKSASEQSESSESSRSSSRT